MNFLRLNQVLGFLIILFVHVKYIFINFFEKIRCSVFFIEAFLGRFT
jgi:hypothetical protein